MAKRKAVEMTDEQKAAKAESRKAERRDRFLKLATKRVRNAIKQLGHVERMANKAGYDYTEDEATKIREAIEKATEKCTDAFAGRPNGTLEFTL